MGEYRKNISYQSCLHSRGIACGSALVGIAGAAEGEGFQKVASFIHKWVYGGNSTGQTPAEIQALCNEILNEVSSVLPLFCIVVVAGSVAGGVIYRKKESKKIR